jgi:hypothetical protein
LKNILASTRKKCIENYNKFSMESNDSDSERETFEKHLDDLAVYFNNKNIHNKLQFTNQLREETINEYRSQMQKVF